MKVINLLILIITVNVYSQKYKVNYTSEVKANHDNIEKLFIGTSGDKNEMKNSLIKEITQKRDYSLFVLDTISYFIELPKIDNSLNANKNYRFGNNENLFFIKNTKSKFSYEQIRIDKIYNVKDSLFNFKWVQTDSIQIVQDSLKLNQAILLNPNDSTRVTAWYSESLPYSHGPEKYWNLPGLILKLKVEFFSSKSLFEEFSFGFSIIENLTRNDIKRINKEVAIKNIITRNEYLLKQEEYRNKLNEIDSEGVER